MTDYNAAVEQARGLIADQTRMAVAPIEAETKYKLSDLDLRNQFALKQMDQQARAKVDEINAQIQLELAQQAAAARASRGGGRGGGGGGGSKGTLTGGELASNLGLGATNNIQRAADNAERAARQTGEQNRQAASYTGQSLQYQTRQRMMGDAASTQTARQNAEMARQAAAYSQRAADEWARRQDDEARRQALSYAGQSANAYRAAQDPNTLYMAQTPTFRTTFTPSTVSDQATRDAYAQAAGTFRTQNNPPALNAADLAAMIATTRQQQQQVVSSIPFYNDPTTGLFTQPQLQQMLSSTESPLYDTMLSQGPVRRIGSIGEILRGTPTDVTYDGIVGPGDRRMGAQNPAASTALEQAMMLAAIDLENQGYKINEAEVVKAMEDITSKSPTAEDVNSLRYGGETIADQQQAELARRADDMKQMQDDNQERSKQVNDLFKAQFRVGTDTIGVSDDDALSLVADAADPGSALAVGMAKVQEMLAKGIKQSEIKSELIANGTWDLRDSYQRAILDILVALAGS